MAGRLSPRCRRAVGVVATVMVSATGLTLAATAGPVHAQAQADAWKPCGSAAANGRIERVEILLALDRSGSLRGVDPDGTKRRRATHGTRERLALLQESVSQLLGRSGSGRGFGIDVALVAFDTTGETLAGFAPVGADHPPDAAIGAALGAGGDTDYGPAVEQALARFESSPNAASDTTCRILVLFTDGILDPYDTAAGRRPALEDQATAHVSNLLADLCDADPGLRRYRQRMDDLGVSTYVAVLRGPAFDRGAGGSHLDDLARASKQMILAMTGHGESPLLGGVAAASGCEPWSVNRAGRVVEIEDIGDLTDELANTVGEVGLAVRQPRILCARSSTVEARLAGEWPHRLVLEEPAARPLCTVSAPLDGEVVLSLAGGGLPAGVEWLIDDGVVEPAARRALAPGDADVSFNVSSSRLPEDEPVGAVADAAVEFAATWYPEPLEAWPEQPTEVPLATRTLRSDLPDREASWLARLVDCREYQRASWADGAGGTLAAAAGLCNVAAPPAGEFELALVAPDGNRLAWSASREAGGSDPERVERGEAVLLEPGDGPLVLGALSQVLAEAEVPLEGFVDGVRFGLTWRSPRGAVLVDRTVAEIGIDVRATTVELIECGAEAQVTDARRNPSGEWALVVDSGCRLLSAPQGAVRATVSGDVRGEAWQLVDPPAAAGEGWPTRPEVALGPSEPDRTLFVGVGHPELADLVGDAVEFTLAATRPGEASGAPDEQRAPRTVTVYLPVPRCEPRVDAVRVEVEPSGGGRSEPRARAANLCEIDPPPGGRLEVRTAGAPPGPDLSWRPVRDGDATDVVIVEPGAGSIPVEAISRALAPGLIHPFETGIDVQLNWRSARGHSSGSARRVLVAVPEASPDLLVCSGEPSARNSGGEVPEGPLVVDTGCVLPAPAAGEVTLDVEGFVAGVGWRLPESLSLAPGDADRPIFVESAGPLPNEPLDDAASFELMAKLTLDDYEPPAHRLRRDVDVRLDRRIRLLCTATPQVVGDPIEVPEGPLVVDTGCTLLAPGAGTVTVRVDGDAAGVPWGLDGEVRLGPGDGDVPIIIRTTAPLPNRRYDTVAEFALAATWRSDAGAEQSVGEQPPAGQAPPEVALALRARPSAGAAVLIGVGLLLAALLAVWLALWLVGRRANRLPRSGEYRLVRSEARAVVRRGTAVDLPDFDAASAIGDDSDPLVRRRARLTAGDLTIRARLRWWDPRELLGGGRADVTLPDRRNLLVAASPAADRPGCLRPSLANGAVIVALERSPAVSATGADEHRARVWLLIESAGPRQSAAQSAAANLRSALAQLAELLGGGPPGAASGPPAAGTGDTSDPGRRPPPPPPRP